jgi:hypothetical protein
MVGSYSTPSTYILTVSNLNIVLLISGRCGIGDISDDLFQRRFQTGGFRGSQPYKPALWCLLQRFRQLFEEQVLRGHIGACDDESRRNLVKSGTGQSC